MNKVSFFRKRAWIANLSESPSENQKACQVVAGFSASVDPLSGMTVNLMKVEEWFDELIAESAARKFPGLVEFIKWIYRSFEDKVRAQTEVKDLQVERIEIETAFGAEKIVLSIDSQMTLRKSMEVIFEGKAQVLSLEFKFVYEEERRKILAASIWKQKNIAAADLQVLKNLGLSKAHHQDPVTLSEWSFTY